MLKGSRRRWRHICFIPRALPRIVFLRVPMQHGRALVLSTQQPQQQLVPNGVGPLARGAASLDNHVSSLERGLAAEGACVGWRHGDTRFLVGA